MSDPHISRLLAEAAPPARDPAFELAVMTRLENRRFRRAMALNLGLAVAGSLLLAVAAPTLNGVWAGLSSNLMIAGLLLAGGALLLQSPLARDD
jgi:hypothetical protein